MIKKRKPIIKLLKLFSLHRDYETQKVCQHHVSNGVWETLSVEEKSDENKKFKRIYTLQCVISWHPNLKIGETRKMNEESIIVLCDEMKLQRLKSMNIHRKKILK